MRDFQNGQVYALKADGIIHYIGSTTQTLENRWKDHVPAYRSVAARYPARRLFQLFDAVGLANVTIEPLEAVACTSYDELLDAERRLILAHGTHVDGCNTRIAGGKPGSRHLTYRANRLQYNKEYHRRLVQARAGVQSA